MKEALQDLLIIAKEVHGFLEYVGPGEDDGDFERMSTDTYILELRHNLEKSIERSNIALRDAK